MNTQVLAVPSSPPKYAMSYPSFPQNQTTRRAIFPRISLRKQKIAINMSTNQDPRVTNAISDQHSRPSADFSPSIWGDHFLSHNSNNVDASMLRQHEELKEEIGSILVDVMEEPSKNLRLIDAIQRLAVDYHFQDEIEIALKKLYHNFDYDENDLNTIALQFRLLRQHGFSASCDVFEKFRDEKGNFKQSLINNVEGMLSLYEAAHLGIRREDILDEAIDFTTKNLHSILSNDNVKPHLREQIKHALIHPIRRRLRRLEARHYIDVYSNEESHNTTLLKFAKLDYNIVQRLYQKEIFEITKWWKSLDVPRRFPYARDRIVEVYFMAVAINFEPHYSHARKMLAKVLAIGSILDDTYDNYATYEEAQLFTEAIQRWDIGEKNSLPECMKMLHALLSDTYNQFEEELAKEGRSFCVDYAREQVKILAKPYLNEVKWRCEGYVPTMEEYMQVSLATSGCQLLGTVSFLGMGDIATKDVFEWISTTPKIVTTSAIACRFLDDIMSHEFEQKRGHVASGVECYMTQYGVKREEAVQLLREDITNAWKDMNEECFRPNPIPMPLLERVFNLVRLADVLYEVDDAYTNPHALKHHVSSLFNDPVDFILQ